MNDQKVKKILVIKLSALGDFIQALGPMRAIRAHHPDAHITLLTTKGLDKMAQDCGYFDEIWHDRRPRWFNFLQWQCFKKRLNKAGFDRVYDLQNNDRTYAYYRLFAAKNRPEWAGAIKGASHYNPEAKLKTKHAFDRHTETLALVGINDVQIDDLGWMQGDISTLGLDPQRPFVLLVAGSAPSRPEKRWPAENFAMLADLIDAAGYQPVLLGTAAEKDATSAIKAACPKALDLTGQTNLGQIVALAHKAAAAVGNDTGPMHMIAASGCRTLTLFSQYSDPVRHAPKGLHTQVLQENELKDLDTATVWTHLALDKV